MRVMGEYEDLGRALESRERLAPRPARVTDPALPDSARPVCLPPTRFRNVSHPSASAPSRFRHDTLHRLAPHPRLAQQPGSVARTSALALTSATAPYVVKLANLGYREALRRDVALRKGLNVFEGKLVNKEVADALKMEFTSYEEATAATG